MENTREMSVNISTGSKPLPVPCVSCSSDLCHSIIPLLIWLTVIGACACRPRNHAVTSCSLDATRSIVRSLN
jgi:hypothetical protein